MSGALEGVRVVEFANYVAGPYAGGLLADLGADVIKVESPPNGDPYRGWANGNYSAMFCSLNQNKRSIVLDLKSARGMEVARALCARADVVIENLRPGAMERLGLGYEDLKVGNEGLIYCSITGFGIDGPYSSRPGYDTVGQAMSGLMSLLTDMDDPKPMGTSLADHLGGLFAAYGILAAYAARTRIGLGQRVDTSLLQATASIIAENFARFLHDGGTPPTRRTRAKTAQVYAVTDQHGAPFVVHLSSPDKFWRALLAAIDRNDLLDDPRFGDRVSRIEHRSDIESILREAFAKGDRATWLERLRAADVPSAPIYDLNEVIEDEQVRHLGLVETVEHPTEGRMRMLGSGVNLHGTPTRTGPAPLANEHAQEILSELGLVSEQLSGALPS
jgi:crotonobetainyl-CoA:carnitine CoA-transferase CaiB-like acyl-CoA transferase